MRNPTAPVAAAALLGAAAFALYAATLSRQPTADSLLFALAVESGDPRALINLHHPLLHPLGWSFVESWRLFGWSGRALLPLQVLNALGGALAVAFLQHLAARVTGSTRIACVVAGGFAVSGAIWLLSTEAEFVTVPLAVNLALLDLAITAAPERWARPAFLFAVGAAIGIAALVYLTNAILLPVAALAARPRSATTPRQWLRRLVLLAGGVLVGLLVPCVVLLVCLRAAGMPALRERPIWVSYGGLDWRSIPRGGYAFVRSLLLYPGLGMNERTSAYLAAADARQRAVFGVYYGLAAVAALVPVGWALRRRHTVLRQHRRTLALLVLWAGAHTAFALYWVPSDCSFWAPTLAAWWLGIALLAAVSAHPHRALAAGAAFAGALLLINAAVFVLPRHDLQRDRPYWVADAIAERTAPADIVITRSDDVLALYLMYFARRTVAIAEDRDRARVVDETLARARARGSRVFAVGCAPPPVSDRFTAGAPWLAAGEPVCEIHQAP